MVTQASMKALLEAGVHFGHQTRRWDPRMGQFIFTERNGIHIIDLQQTVQRLHAAAEFVRDMIAGGQEVLFVGTKKQARESIQNEATRASAPYVTNRWLGGTLTNFVTIQKRIDHLVRLEEGLVRGDFERLPKKEVLKIEQEVERMNRKFGGVKSLTRLPGAMFIVDPGQEHIALAEAQRLKIPVVAMCDTDSNPDAIDYPIPSNDDAIRAVKLISAYMADAVLEGMQMREFAAEGVTPGEMTGEMLEAGTFSFSPEDEPAPAPEEETAAPESSPAPEA